MKKSIIVFILLIIFFPVYPTAAGEVKFISQSKDSFWQQTLCWQQGNPLRPIFSLDGEWEYNINEKNSYKKVILPASCNYEGEITFRKSFILDSTFTSHFFRLICYGINYYCRIFINEKFVGSHSGGYSSFAFDIADGVMHITKKNTIEIKVDTRLDSKRTIPHRFQPDGVGNTAGIFRSIYILAIPELSIEDVTVDYQLWPDFSKCDLAVNFNLKDRINNIANYEFKKGYYIPFQYYIELSTKSGNIPILQETKEIDIQDYVLTRTISTQLKIKQPQLWSPESPSLYSLRIQLLQGGQVIDQHDQSLGFKQLDFRSGNTYLNGNRLVLEGVNWAEDYLLSGALFDRKQLLQDLELVKQLHANAIRVLKHPAHPILTALCDSMGLFLLQEIPLDWIPTIQLASENFINYCSDYLYETVSRDHQHVSAFAWGIGGNFLFSDSLTKKFVNEIIQNLRIISEQSFYIWNSPTSITDINDTSIFQGISIFDLEKNRIHNVLSEWLKQNRGQLSYVLSYGSPQLGGSSDSDNNTPFEEYQVLQIVEAWRSIASFSDIDGFFITALSDFQGPYPSTIYRNYHYNHLRPLGLTDYNRKKRVAFETIRSLYQEGKARYNPGVEMKDELPAVFPLAGLGTILVFLFMFNSRRYFRESLKRIFIHPHGFYVDIRDGRKIPPSHTILIAIFISVGCGLILASLISFFKNQPHIDHLMTILLITDDLKMKFCHLCWNPVSAVLIFSMLSLMIFVFIAFYFKFLALITRKRCSVTQSLTMLFWLGGNFIIFIPLGMILFRIMKYEHLILPTFGLIFIILIWFILRLAKGMRVLFIWTIRRAFIVVIVTILAISAGILYYYQYHYALIDYVKFYYQIYGTHILTAYLL